MKVRKRAYHRKQLRVDDSIEQVEKIATPNQLPDWKRKAMVNANYAHYNYIPLREFNQRFPGHFANLYEQQYVKPTKEETNNHV